MFDFTDYVEINLNKVRPSGGDELVCECLFCSKPQHLYINRDTGDYICFSCDERGRGLVGIVAEVEGITEREAKRLIFRESVNFRRRKRGVTVDEAVAVAKSKFQEVLDSRRPLPVDNALPDEFVPVWDGKRYRLPAYLASRGVTREKAREWGLGYCKRGKYGQRVVFPVRCPNGRSFVARDITGESELKYTGPRGAQHSRLVYGYHTLVPGRPVVVVEGPMDVLAIDRHGFPVVGLFGKNVSDEQVMLLHKAGVEDVVVLLDPEEVEGRRKVASALLGAFRVRVGVLPDGVDPGDSTKDQAVEAISLAEVFKADARGKAAALAARLSRFR